MINSLLFFPWRIYHWSHCKFQCSVFQRAVIFKDYGFIRAFSGYSPLHPYISIIYCTNYSQFHSLHGFLTLLYCKLLKGQTTSNLLSHHLAQCFVQIGTHKRFVQWKSKCLVSQLILRANLWYRKCIIPDLEMKKYLVMLQIFVGFLWECYDSFQTKYTKVYPTHNIQTHTVISAIV